MLEELLEVVWGPWGLAALLVAGTQTGRNLTRKAAREVVKGGLVAGDAIKQVAARAQESTADLVAEARSELKNGKAQHQEKPKKSSKSSS